MGFFHRLSKKANHFFKKAEHAGSHIFHKIEDVANDVKHEAVVAVDKTGKVLNQGAKIANQVGNKLEKGLTEVASPAVGIGGLALGALTGQPEIAMAGMAASGALSNLGNNIGRANRSIQQANQTAQRGLSTAKGQIKGASLRGAFQ